MKKKVSRVKKKKRVPPEKRAPAWTPEMPLPSARHEMFVQTLARGQCSQAAAHASVYGGDAHSATAMTNAARLLRNARIAARLDWIRKQSAAAVMEELGITKTGLCRRLLEMLDAPPHLVALAAADAMDASKEKQLTDGQRHLLKLASSVEPTMYGWKVKLSDKVSVARELASIMGWRSEDVSAATAADAAKQSAEGLAALVALARRQGSFAQAEND